MIPFCNPQDHVVINLNQIVRLVEHPLTSEGSEKVITVHYVNGKSEIFSGRPAEIVAGQVMLCFQIFQASLAQVTGNASQIVVPSGVMPPTNGH